MVCQEKGDIGGQRNLYLRQLGAQWWKHWTVLMF